MGRAAMSGPKAAAQLPEEILFTKLEMGVGPAKTWSGVPLVSACLDRDLEKYLISISASAARCTSQFTIEGSEVMDWKPITTKIKKIGRVLPKVLQRCPSGTSKGPSETLTLPLRVFDCPSGTLKGPSGTLKGPSGTLTLSLGDFEGPLGEFDCPSGSLTVPQGL